MFKNVLILLLLAAALEAPSVSASVAAPSAKAECGELEASIGPETVHSLKLSVVKPGDSMDTREEALRTTAANALLAIYWHINRNAEKQEASIPYEDYVIPGGNWPPLKKKEVYLIPVLDGDLTKALDDIRGNERYPCEGTIASGFGVYALVETLLAKFKNEFLNPSCIDAAQEIFKPKKEQGKSEWEDYVPQHAMEMAKGCIFNGCQDGAQGIQPGDRVYIHGHPDYIKKHEHGGFRGENLYLIGYDANGLKMYIGFGCFFMTGPKTAKGIQTHLAAKYLEGTVFSSPAEEQEKLSVAFEKIRLIAPASFKLNVELILELQKPERTGLPGSSFE